jgi:hypothetical protein
MTSFGWADVHICDMNNPTNSFLGFAVVALALVVSSCASVKIAESADTKVLFEVNELAHRLKAELYLEDGSDPVVQLPIVAQNLFVSLDSARWKDEAGAARSASRGSLRKVVFRDHPEGASLGLRYGLLVGGLGGVAGGLSSEPDGYLFTSRSSAAFFSGLIFGLLGGAVGASSGAVVGRQYIFSFND